MTATVIDIADLRARRATGQPPVDKPAHRVSSTAVWTVGTWVKTTSNLRAIITGFFEHGGDQWAALRFGSTDISAPIKTLTRTAGPDGAA